MVITSYSRNSSANCSLRWYLSVFREISCDYLPSQHSLRSNFRSNGQLRWLLPIPVTPALIAPYGDVSLSSKISCNYLPPQHSLTRIRTNLLCGVALEFPRPNPLRARRVEWAGLQNLRPHNDTCSGMQAISFLGASPRLLANFLRSSSWWAPASFSSSSDHLLPSGRSRDGTANLFLHQLWSTTSNVNIDL
jgi:hypothetical protein